MQKPVFTFQVPQVAFGLPVSVVLSIVHVSWLILAIYTIYTYIDRIWRTLSNDLSSKIETERGLKSTAQKQAKRRGVGCQTVPDGRQIRFERRCYLLHSRYKRAGRYRLTRSGALHILPPTNLRCLIPRLRVWVLNVQPRTRTDSKYYCR